MLIHEIIIHLLSKTLNFIDNLSYLQIGLIAALEGTCFPVFIPMETIILPMGYLAFLGKKNFALLLFSLTLGTVCGCLINYYFAMIIGRPLIFKYHKYMMFKISTLEKWEKRFLKNSKFIMFIGRCIPLPIVKHIITIPAGISRMNIFDFIIYNTLGATLFTSVILYIGYYFGQKMDIIHQYMKFTVHIFIVIVIIFVIYRYFLSHHVDKYFKKIF